MCIRDSFDALSELPAGYSDDGSRADTDGEWTFIDNMDGTGQITHQRADNSRYSWNYNSGIQEGDEPSGDNTAVGSLGERETL